MVIASRTSLTLFINALCCGLLAACAAVHDGHGGTADSEAAAAGSLSRRSVIGGKDTIVPGAVITDYMNRQARALQPLADTARIGDGIIVTLPEEVLFKAINDQLQPRALTLLGKIAMILRRYDQTRITVVGNTDNRGYANFDIHLSERRARAVADILTAAGIRQERIDIIGMGFARPVAGNDNAAGRTRNRRVEIHIAPDRKLRHADRTSLR